MYAKTDLGRGEEKGKGAKGTRGAEEEQVEEHSMLYGCLKYTMRKYIHLLEQRLVNLRVV